MALANQLGLTSKVVSERHYRASQVKFTAGQAAKFITKAVNKKLSAKDVRSLFKLKFKCDMEWHHSGFYKGTSGQTMGRTYFISPNDMQQLVTEFGILYPLLEEHKNKANKNVYAFYWEWENAGTGKRPRWCKVLKTYEGKKSDLPKNSTECKKEIYEVAKKAEGCIYKGWDAPDISEFNDDTQNNNENSNK